MIMQGSDLGGARARDISKPAINRRGKTGNFSGGRDQ
jgi:hypothetical protein